MIYRPDGISIFEFAVVASLRAKQLKHGAVPRVPGDHTPVITAQLEVLCGKVAKIVEGAVDGQEVTGGIAASSDSPASASPQLEVIGPGLVTRGERS